MQHSLFEKIEQRTVEDEIAQRLREAIVSQRIGIGERLNESELAKGLDVSRIPIREALRKLEQEGLVERFPNRGCFVIKFTEQDVREIFSLRANLECMSFEWVMPHLTDEDIGYLRDLIERQHSAIVQKRYGKLSQLDMQFHEYICERAGHQRLLKAWREQHAQCQIMINIRFRAMPDYTPDTVLVDHTQILDALKRRDVAAASQLTQQISQRVIDECIPVLESIRKPS